MKSEWLKGREEERGCVGGWVSEVRSGSGIRA